LNLKVKCEVDFVCGIAGAVFKENVIVDAKIKLLNKSLDLIRYRGPDNKGVYMWNNVGLGHVRLSIIDVTKSGHQPMVSSNDENVISYNGEVYNYRELKKDSNLVNEVYASETDTEVILKGFNFYGTEFFKKLNGMFAFVLLDKKTNKLFIVRDRFGVKPLHYYENKKGIFFGSEIKSVLCLVEDRVSMNTDVLSEWSYYGNSLGENTFYKGIKKLLPGHFLEIDLNTFKLDCHSYWQPESLALKNNTNSCGVDTIVKNVKELLENSVKRQLVSDVPVGVFLSGGIDSSAITAFAAKHYGSQLKTYSVGFDFDKGVNELPNAKKIAEKFGTDHHELKISGYDLVDTLELLVHHHDAPFSDAANIPLFLLGKKVNGEVKVVLQGDGGDEIFAGYKRYQTLSSKWLWGAAAPLLASFHDYLPHNKAFYLRQRYINALKSKDDSELMALLLTTEHKEFDPRQIFSKDIRHALADIDPFGAYVKCDQRFESMNLVQRMLITDTQIILPDIFLEKVDRSTMASSIEVRVPFLDYELTDYVMSLPSSLKVKRGQKKWLLKKALIGIVPDDILFDKKRGFGVPYQYWLKGPLNELFYDKLAQLDASGNKILDFEKIRILMNEHVKGIREHGFLLWKTLNLMIWLSKHSELN